MVTIKICNNNTSKRNLKVICSDNNLQNMFIGLKKAVSETSDNITLIITKPYVYINPKTVPSKIEIIF